VLVLVSVKVEWCSVVVNVAFLGVLAYFWISEVREIDQGGWALL
jgi:hypothetical protein